GPGSAGGAGVDGAGVDGAGPGAPIPDGSLPGGHGEGVRRLLAGLAFTGAVAAASWAVIPQLPGMGGHGGTLRRPPPTVSPVATSPVDVMASLRDDDPTAPPTPLLRVQTTRPFDGYLPIAVLDTYDGDLWSFDRTFQPTGGRIPPPPPLAPQATGPRFTVSIDLLRPLAPSLPLVPYPERPLRVSGITVDEDPSTGMIVPAASLHPPTAYRVEARSPLQTLAALPSSAAIDLGASVPDLQLTTATATDLTSTLRYLAAATGQRPAPDVAFLKALASTLKRDDRRVDPLLAAASGAPPTRGGTSLAEVVSAITVSQEATPEQFATLFAVVARDVGVPARLVTGFRLAPPGRPLAPGTYTVTNRQAWTWVEVPVAGLGWVVVDPTPALTGAAHRPPPVAAATTPPTTAAPPANAVPANAPGTHALAPPPRFPRAAGPALPLVVVVAGAVIAGLALLGALALGWAAGRRALRRRARRRREHAPALAVGAWLDLLDGLERAGLPPHPSATAREVGLAVAATFGPDLEEPVARVGALAEQAVCSRAAPLDPHAALRAWDASRQVSRTVASRLGRSQRWQARLRVGSQPRRPLVRAVPAADHGAPGTGQGPQAPVLVGSAPS
ncbi:MAG TPA: transglutaminase domain-containing protein, partial [Acidimicrobiales bacterium]|nr:transglutaminase domain-containing protein [Acidimicrobiales bacterium]